MAVVDMPLEQLLLYEGKNPCPVNFDKFWDDSIKEMESVNPNLIINKADFQTSFANCYDMYFTGVREARIYAKLIIPKNAKSSPAALLFHGYSGRSGDWVDLLTYAAQGFVIAALDCRGQGGKSQDTSTVTGNTLNGHIIRGLNDNPEDLLFRQIFLDTAQIAEIVAGLEHVDKNRIMAFGGSQGGALTLACAGLSNLIKKAAPIYPFLSDYKRIWEMDLRTDAYLELWEYFRKFDPLHQQEDEIFEKLGYIDVQHMAKRIKAEVLMGISLRDDICPPSTQFAIYNKIKSPKEMVLYRDFGHEGLPGLNDRIFQWLSNF